MNRPVPNLCPQAPPRCCHIALHLVWTLSELVCMIGQVFCIFHAEMITHFCVCTGIDACKRWPQGLVLKDEQMSVSEEGSFRMHWTEHMELDKEE